VSTDADLFKKCLVATNFNWLTGGDFSKDRKVIARIRSRHEGAPAKVKLYAGDRVGVEFDEAQRAITPGQAVVLYENDIVVGGGWIEKVQEALV